MIILSSPVLDRVDRSCQKLVGGPGRRRNIEHRREQNREYQREQRGGQDADHQPPDPQEPQRDRKRAGRRDDESGGGKRPRVDEPGRDETERPGTPVLGKQQLHQLFVQGGQASARGDIADSDRRGARDHQYDQHQRVRARHRGDLRRLQGESQGAAGEHRKRNQVEDQHALHGALLAFPILLAIATETMTMLNAKKPSATGRASTLATLLEVVNKTTACCSKCGPRITASTIGRIGTRSARNQTASAVAPSMTTTSNTLLGSLSTTAKYRAPKIPNSSMKRLTAMKPQKKV